MGTHPWGWVATRHSHIPQYAHGTRHSQQLLTVSPTAQSCRDVARYCCHPQQCWAQLSPPPTPQGHILPTELTCTAPGSGSARSSPHWHHSAPHCAVGTQNKWGEPYTSIALTVPTIPWHCCGVPTCCMAWGIRPVPLCSVSRPVKWVHLGQRYPTHTSTGMGNTRRCCQRRIRLVWGAGVFQCCSEQA